MGRPEEPYYIIVVETYRISGSGLHGDIHVRPVKGEQFPQTIHVRFPRKVRHAHPIGTRFRVYAKLTDKEGGNPFLHTNHAWIMKFWTTRIWLEVQRGKIENDRIQ